MQKDTEILVILIDTGRASQLNSILGELREVLKKYGKAGPDLVVCTHYDFDHIGCLQEIVGRYKIHTREVWMHQTSQLIAIAEKLEGTEDVTGLILPDEEAQELKVEGNGIIDYDDDDIQGVLHHLKHEVEALASIKEMGFSPKEPIQEVCSFPGWPEIEVIGPTQDYYKSLFPDHFNFSRFLESEKAELKAGKEDSPSGKDPFESLDDCKRTPLTATNLNSAILLITTEQGKFLFAGDAGIESFQRIPGYPGKIENIHFLKVPHHGSANNLNSELIQVMNPRIAFISGGSHVSNRIVEALQHQGAMVAITKDSGRSLVYPIQG